MAERSKMSDEDLDKVTGGTTVHTKDGKEFDVPWWGFDNNEPPVCKVNCGTLLVYDGTKGGNHRYHCPTCGLVYEKCDGMSPSWFCYDHDNSMYYGNYDR